MHYLIIILIIFIMLTSVWQYVSYKINREKKGMYRAGISFELFYTLLIIYGIIIIGFGNLYFIWSFYRQILVEIGQVPTMSTQATLYRSFYFSGVTMLTIGYGDIIPVGIGRLLAIIQALIGYVLPTAFVFKLIHINVTEGSIQDKSSNK